MVNNKLPGQGSFPRSDDAAFMGPRSRIASICVHRERRTSLQHASALPFRAPLLPHALRGALGAESVNKPIETVVHSTRR
jgi:hypothetical protein